MRYAASAGTLAIAGSGSYGLAQAYEPPRVDVIPVPDMALEGLTKPIDIIQVTDLHYGMFYYSSELEALVEKLNSMDGAAVVITGDIFHSPRTPVESAAPFLRKLRRRRWGNFAILGNHDFYAGVKRSVKAINDGGLRLLRNEWVSFNQDKVNIHLGGIDDPKVNWLTGNRFPDFDLFIKRQPSDTRFPHPVKPSPCGVSARRKREHSVNIVRTHPWGSNNFSYTWVNTPMEPCGTRFTLYFGNVQIGKLSYVSEQGCGADLHPGSNKLPTGNSCNSFNASWEDLEGNIESKVGVTRVMEQQSRISKHLDLVSQGWERRFSAEDPRLTEMNEYYRSLGFETLVVDGVIGRDAACRSCFDSPGFGGQYKTLYTRGASTKGSSGEDDIF